MQGRREQSRLYLLCQLRRLIDERPGPTIRRDFHALGIRCPPKLIAQLLNMEPGLLFGFQTREKPVGVGMPLFASF